MVAAFRHAPGGADAGHSLRGGEVLPNSPAAQAGLKVGDSITAVNGVHVWNPSALDVPLKKGEPLMLDVTGKDGAVRQVTVQGRLPENWHNSQDGSLLKGAQPILGWSGI